MSPIIHFLLAIPLCIALFPFFGWNVWIILLSSVIIDIDHLPVYIIMFKNLNLKKMDNFFKKNTCKIADKLCAVLHTIEFLVIIGLLALYSKIFFLILVGLLYHIIIDNVVVYKTIHKIRTFSIILWLNYYLKNRNTDEFKDIKKKALF